MVGVLVPTLILPLSLMTTLACLIVGFPTAYFIATRPRQSRNFWLFLITIPFWTNLLIRTFAILEVIRNKGLVNMVLLKAGVIDSPIQMIFSDFAIMVGMAYVYLPLMVLPLYASMERLDFNLVEAAYDLYATRGKVLRRVIIMADWCGDSTRGDSGKSRRMGENPIAAT